MYRLFVNRRNIEKTAGAGKYTAHFMQNISPVFYKKGERMASF
jgi:hypothetical protein